jgi:hypothetical protein
MKHKHGLWRKAKLKLMEKRDEKEEHNERTRTLEAAQEDHVSPLTGL